MAVNPNKLFIRVGKGSITGGQIAVADVIAKSKTAGNTTKVFFIADTNQIVVDGVAYGLSTDTNAEIDKIKSILSTYFADGTEDNVKTAIDAVKTALDNYKTANDKVVADNKKDIEAKAFGGVAYNANTKAIDFTAVDGSALGSVKASDIIGNHIVKSNSYDAATNTLKLTFGGAEADANVDIDLGQMLDMDDVISGDTAHFTANYAEKKLTLTPVVGKLAGDAATAGLADAEEARAYVDAAIAAANRALDDYKKATDARLDKLEGDGEGSVAKALADAKAYTDEKVTAEADRAKAAEKTLTNALADEVTRADAAEKANAADIAAINTALESADTFWDDYIPDDNKED